MMAIRILQVISSHTYSYFTFKKCFHIKNPQICIVGYVLHNSVSQIKIQGVTVCKNRTNCPPIHGEGMGEERKV